MLDTPQIKKIDAQAIAVIHLTIPRDDIREVMMPGLEELRAEVAAQGIAVTGPWFTHHLRMQEDIFDFEIGVPVASAVAVKGRVKPSMRPAMRAAQTIYRGAFEGLGDAWGEFMDWIEAGGHTPAEDLWERYLTGPGENPDPATWSTELTKPLVAR